MKDNRHRSNHNIAQTNSKAQLSDILFPKKYEKLSILFYIIVVPFLMGHIFLFTYVSKFNYSIYSAICSDNNGLLTWCMGYEGFAILVFAIFFIGALINIIQQQHKLR